MPLSLRRVEHCSRRRAVNVRTVERKSEARREFPGQSTVSEGKRNQKVAEGRAAHKKEQIIAPPNNPLRRVNVEVSGAHKNFGRQQPVCPVDSFANVQQLGQHDCSLASS